MSHAQILRILPPGKAAEYAHRMSVLAHDACPGIRHDIGLRLFEVALEAIDEAVKLEREACAALMESDARGAARESRFCRMCEHMQGTCECIERADAIRDRCKVRGAEETNGEEPEETPT